MSRFSFALFSVIFASSVYGQAGVSSSSVGISRAGIAQTNSAGRYRLPMPDYFRVAEFVNYHRHDLPLPKGDKVLKVSLSKMQSTKNKSIFQIGLTTPRSLDIEKSQPMNLVLVIDRSGSMSGDRISKVKTALRKFAERIRPSDRIAIVSFGNDTTVHLAHCEGSDQETIFQTIDAIRINGGTNLHGGLMRGFEVAKKHYDSERTNRVVFLTDGNANQGITDSEAILKDCQPYFEAGITLTTIGLGRDFNHDLLRLLSDQGKGHLHFVEDTKDIIKTFVTEVDSLLYPAARDIVIEFNSLKCRPRFFGHSSVSKNGKQQIELENMNCGATQVVLFEVDGEDVDPGKVVVKYRNAQSHRSEQLTKQFRKVDWTPCDSAKNQSIQRNYAIAVVAESLRKAAQLSNQGDGNCRAAERSLQNGIELASSIASCRSDKPIADMVKIATDYRKEILECIARNND